jgi:hypothetical protein
MSIMRLNVDLTALKIETAKMQGLEVFLNCVRDLKIRYEPGLQQAIQYIRDNHGTVEILDGGVTRLTLNGFQADCFRPFPDIDRFYFEY